MYASLNADHNELMSLTWAQLAHDLIITERRTDPKFCIEDTHGMSKETLVDCILITRYGYDACRNLPTVKLGKA
jgi:hypothetical protein